MWTSRGPYKSSLPSLLRVNGTTLRNFKSPKQLAMWSDGSFTNPLKSLHVVYTKKALKLF
jgi:hypothetical protein